MDFLSIPMQKILTILYDLTASLGFPSYGIAILILTFLLKLLTYPLTVKQLQSMKAMQDLQPKIKNLQEKYQGNKEKLNKEIAILYKESGVNPIAGCLPLLIQMPVLMAIFYALQGYSYAGPSNFLWLPDMTQPDPLHIMPVISVITTYIQQKQTMASSPTSSEGMQNQQAKMMLYFMPLFIGYISWTFSAGLVLYWAFSNVLQIVQQWWMYRKPQLNG